MYQPLQCLDVLSWTALEGRPSLLIWVRMTWWSVGKMRVHFYLLLLQLYLHQIHPHLTILVLEIRYPCYVIFERLVTDNNRHT